MCTSDGERDRSRYEEEFTSDTTKVEEVCVTVVEVDFMREIVVVDMSLNNVTSRVTRNVTYCIDMCTCTHVKPGCIMSLAKPVFSDNDCDGEGNLPHNDSAVNSNMNAVDVARDTTHGCE